jgi:hypothetical protein
MLGADLAALYEVPTRVLNQAVRRNLRRFPEEFMFQLTTEEASALRVTNCDLSDGPGTTLQIRSTGVYRVRRGYALLGIEQ